MALLAVALSKEIYGGAPVYVTDTEPGWHFLKRRIFDVEGVELIQRTEPTFKAMTENLREAEKLGVCVWAVDSLTVIWQELMQTYKNKQGFIPIDMWGDIKQTWNSYINLFMNSRMCCFALGRIGQETDEIQDEENPNKTKLVKVGTKFKAGGGESFGYEPHLLLELSLERKAKTKAGSKLEGEGRMVHRVDVLKDRTWALNGKVIRWSDKPGYSRGGYRTVWESLKPHFDEVQLTMQHVTLRSGSSASLINDDGHGEYWQRRKCRDVLVEELDAALQLLWGGNGQAEKRMRMLVGEALFGVRSKSALEQLELDKVERGVKIIQGFEQRVKAEGMPTSEAGVLSLLDIDIKNHDEGAIVEQSLPF
jgi:hypothetical protein